MLTFRDSLSLYRVHHPPVFVCVRWGFFWYQGDLATRFSTDVFITLKWLSYFQLSPSSIFFAFALTIRSIVQVRCLHKSAKGRQKGHESKNLGSHLLVTHLLGRPKQNGGWWPNMIYHHGLCLLYVVNVLSISWWCLESHSMAWLQLKGANKIKIFWMPGPPTKAFHDSGFSDEIEKKNFNGKGTLFQSMEWQKEEESPSLKAMNLYPI